MEYATGDVVVGPRRWGVDSGRGFCHSAAVPASTNKPGVPPMRSPLLTAGVVMGVSLGVSPGVSAAGQAASGTGGAGHAAPDTSGGWSSGRRASLDLRGPWLFRQAPAGKKGPPPAQAPASDGEGWM